LGGLKYGQIIKTNFNPTTGHEQGGIRPAVIMSNNFCLARISTVFICPITNKKKRYPTHIPLDERTKTTGEILCEQMRAVDMTDRYCEYIEDLPVDLVERVRDIVATCITAKD
jgi:mRNA interferase MazF